ncbi:hypothetical protein [Labilibaculum euxinus]
MTEKILLPQGNDKWLYIVPIYYLTIGKEIKEELEIGRVHFVRVSKIARIRKKLGLPIVFSKLKGNKHTEEFFKEANTYAFYTFTGNQKDKKLLYNIRIEIDRAVNIIAFSQLGFCNRNNNSQFGIIKQNLNITYYVLSRSENKSTLSLDKESKVLPFDLNKNWFDFHNFFFFFKLIDLINSRNKIQKSWKETIIRACEMIGESMMSRDLVYAFLWNMIVVEMLLTGQGDKYIECLPERAEAFIGWVGYWKEKSYKDKIQNAYKKRCQFVHDENSKNISVEDVVFTDDLVFNLLWNIIDHIDLFPTKDSIKEFSEKIKAEKLLGVKPSVQPGTLHHFNTERDLSNFIRI